MRIKTKHVYVIQRTEQYPRAEMHPHEGAFMLNICVNNSGIYDPMHRLVMVLQEQLSAINITLFLVVESYHSKEGRHHPLSFPALPPKSQLEKQARVENCSVRSRSRNPLAHIVLYAISCTRVLSFETN